MITHSHKVDSMLLEPFQCSNIYLHFAKQLERRDKLGCICKHFPIHLSHFLALTRRGTRVSLLQMLSWTPFINCLAFFLARSLGEDLSKSVSLCEHLQRSRYRDLFLPGESEGVRYYVWADERAHPLVTLPGSVCTASATFIPSTFSASRRYSLQRHRQSS